MSKHPLVSVYITSHNREDLIERAIKSVLNQTYKNIEIIIVDDASTDKTVEKINSYVKSNNNIRLFVNEKNMGACYSRNLAIKSAKGEYITGLDDDDAFDLDRIEYFISNYNDSFSFFATPIKVKSKRFNYISQKKTGLVNISMISNFNCVGNQVFIKTDKLRSIGGFDEAYPAWQDYDLIFRLINTFGTAFKLNRATYLHYTDHEYGRITNPKKIEKAHELFIEKFKCNLSASNLASLNFTKLLTQREKIPFKTLVSRLKNRDVRVFKYLLVQGLFK
ncbi:glycosyltransferase [Vibrio fluvialis]|nr:glycosyltransferase [Vibrio fluvialis]